MISGAICLPLGLTLLGLVYGTGDWSFNKALVGAPGLFLTVTGALLLAFPSVLARIRARPEPRPLEVTRRDFRVVFKSAPRAGRRLEGMIFPLQGVQAGESYPVKLECIHYHGASTLSHDTLVVHLQEATIKAVDGPEGLHLPFSFDVPMDAPPSLGTGLAGISWVNHWSLNVGVLASLFRSSSIDIEMEPPTESEIRAKGYVPAAGEEAWLWPSLKVVGKEAKVRPWLLGPKVVKSAELIRRQKAAWSALNWALLAGLLAFFGAVFVAGMLSA